MHHYGHDDIGQLLARSLSRDLILSVAEALQVGASRAYRSVALLDTGHRASALGQARHFQMNEAFWAVLAARDCSPNPLKGNGVVIGRAGDFRLTRINCRHNEWNRARRSQTRLRLAESNYGIECMITGDIFDPYIQPVNSSAFFVSTFPAKLSEKSEVPLHTYVAIPDSNLNRWLFVEEIIQFSKRYDIADQQRQPDNAVPKLKKNKNKKESGDSDEGEKT